MDVGLYTPSAVELSDVAELLQREGFDLDLSEEWNNLHLYQAEPLYDAYVRHNHYMEFHVALILEGIYEDWLIQHIRNSNIKSCLAIEVKWNSGDRNKAQQALYHILEKFDGFVLGLDDRLYSKGELAQLFADFEAFFNSPDDD